MAGAIAVEIGPIPGIRALGAVGARRRVLEPPAIFDIDGSAKPGDGVVERAGRQAAGAEEDEDERLLDDEDSLEGDDAQKSVDYFA